MFVKNKIMNAYVLIYVGNFSLNLTSLDNFFLFKSNETTLLPRPASHFSAAAISNYRHGMLIMYFQRN